MKRKVYLTLVFDCEAENEQMMRAEFKEWDGTFSSHSLRGACYGFVKQLPPRIVKFSNRIKKQKRPSADLEARKG